MVKPVLIDKVERDHQQTDAQFLRRRIVVAVTIVVGATLLGLSFSTEPGDPSFYPLTFGARRDLGRRQPRLRPAAPRPHRARAAGPGARSSRPIVVGLLLAGVFVVGGLVTREIPVLAQFTNNVLGYAKAGSLWLVALVTLVNGVAEELFFRGALFAAIGRKNPVVISTLLYALATVAGGNPVLVFAAAILGLVTGLQRRAGGGVLAPVLTHVTWSMGMLLVLPHIFR